MLAWGFKPQAACRPSDEANIVARNQETIIFPASARILWRLARFAPGLTSSVHLQTIRAFRKIRQRDASR